MSDVVDALILDLLEWLAVRPRPYAEVMAAWRTSCPRLPVWEDANDRGFVERRRLESGATLVSLTDAGEAHLRRHRERPGGTAAPFETPARAGSSG